MPNVARRIFESRIVGTATANLEDILVGCVCRQSGILGSILVEHIMMTRNASWYTGKCCSELSYVVTVTSNLVQTIGKQHTIGEHNLTSTSTTRLGLQRIADIINDGAVVKIDECITV